MLTQMTDLPDNHSTFFWKVSGRSVQKNKDPEDNSKVIWTHCRFGLAEKPQPSPCWLRLAIHWTSDFQDDMSVSSSSSHNTSKKFRTNGRKPLIQIWTRPTSPSRHSTERQLTDLLPVDFPVTHASTSPNSSTPISSRIFLDVDSYTNNEPMHLSLVCTCPLMLLAPCTCF